MQQAQAIGTKQHIARVFFNLCTFNYNVLGMKKSHNKKKVSTETMKLKREIFNNLRIM